MHVLRNFRVGLFLGPGMQSSRTTSVHVRGFEISLYLLNTNVRLVQLSGFDVLENWTYRNFGATSICSNLA